MSCIRASITRRFLFPVVPSIGRQVLPATDTETAPSVLWLATIQCVESNQDLAGLTPKDCFIPTKPVERIHGQIGQTQKAMCEVGGGIKVLLPGAGTGFRSVCDVVRCAIRGGIDRISPPRPCGDNFLRLCLSLAALPEPVQMASLDFEQAGFHSCGAPQSPQQTG
jgi:hypothetical protein